jgi:hypothetical protein
MSAPQSETDTETETAAYLLWSEIIDKHQTEPREHHGIAGRAYTGGLNAIIAGMFPQLVEDAEACRRLYAYLKLSQNMLCVGRGRTPTWWLRGVWRSGPLTEPLSYLHVKQEKRLAQRREQVQAGGTFTVVPDPITCLKAIIEENRQLRAEVARLEAGLEKVRAALGESGG